MLQKTDKELQLIGSMGALKPLFFLLSVPSLSGGKKHLHKFIAYGLFYTRNNRP